MSQLDPECGVNGAQVRIFLGELRTLDLDRAIEVWNAYAVAQERGWAASFEAAETLAAKQRTNAWLYARQAAGTIARERLGDPAMVGEVVEVLASVAGSIVIRDLLSRHDFKVLQLPWTWDGESAELPVAAAAAAGLAVTPSAAAARAPWQLGGSAAVPAAVAGVVAVVAVIGAVALFGRPTANVADLGPTGSGFGGVETTQVFEPSPLGSSVALVSPSPLETTSSTESAAPQPTGAPGPQPTAGPGPTAGPRPTPAPTHAPGPTPKPTQPPPPPTATPQPTPTPQGMCEVANLIGLNTVKAQENWSAAGFTGSVTFSPAVPPQYKIVWQSLNAGASVTCSHGITVSDHAP